MREFIALKFRLNTVILREYMFCIFKTKNIKFFPKVFLEIIDTKQIIMKYLLFACFSVFILHGASAQDARLTQFESAPLLLSPANTGNFKGDFRATSTLSKVSNDTLHNNFSNIGFDYKFGKKKANAFGFSYSHSGANGFSMSGDYYGVSGSHLLSLDSNKVHALRFGFQASYMVGKYDLTKPGFTPLLDPKSFYYYNPKAVGDLDFFSNKYMNFALGIDYSLTKNNFKFETSIGAYNISNPKYSIIKMKPLEKRVRLAVSNSFSYKVDNLNTLKISQFTWQEGLYLRKSNNNKSDSLNLSETTYGMEWTRGAKLPYSIGLYSRSLKTASVMVGTNIFKGFFAKMSYEFPLYKSYYSIRQFGLSLVYIKD